MIKKRSTIRTASKHALIIFGSIGCMLALLIGILIVSREDTTSTSNPAEVIVDPHSGPQQIIGALDNQGYIKHPVFVRIAIVIASTFKKIEAGGYYLTRAMNDWEVFKSLANPSLRYVYIAPGMRKQEIADLVGDKLDWNTVQKRELVNINMNLNLDDLEGKYYPGTYLFSVNADPEDVGKEMTANYEKEISIIAKKYPRTTINYDTALLIASIIQREAAGKQDMRLISGVIWNRIFKGMSLEMDATVQYARGKTDKGWWSPIKASDIRTIDSPYNTYKNDGLPPTPISNPGPDAIEAALNPQKTTCLFYLHDNNRNIHCSPTGEGHARNINAYLK